MVFLPLFGFSPHLEDCITFMTSFSTKNQICTFWCLDFMTKVWPTYIASSLSKARAKRRQLNTSFIAMFAWILILMFLRLLIFIAINKSQHTHTHFNLNIEPQFIFLRGKAVNFILTVAVRHKS